MACNQNASPNAFCNGSAGNAENELDVRRRKLEPPSFTAIVTDPANICTFVGVLCSTAAMAYINNKRYVPALCLMVIANMMDLIDGPIARQLTNRHPSLGAMGSKLDSHADMVCHYVTTGVLLVQLGDAHPLCVLFAGMWALCGIVRLSSFEMTEVFPPLGDYQCHYGITSDYLVCAVALSMPLKFVMREDGYMCILLFGLMALFMWGGRKFMFRSRSYDNKGSLSIVVGYHVALAFFYMSQLMVEPYPESTLGNWMFVYYVTMLLLAYPCYFRFIEINK